MTESRAIRQAIVIGIMALVMSVGATKTSYAQGFISPFLGYDFGGDSGCPEITGCEDKNLNWGVGVGSLGAIFGAELEFSYATDFFGDTPGVNSSVLTLMGNVLLAPKFGPVQPYGLVGLGLVKTNVELEAASLLENDNNNLGWDIGGGLFIFFSDHVGIRGDIRYFHAFQDLELFDLALGAVKLDFGRAAGALVFKF